VAGTACFLASTKLKRACGYDDSLDVFGVHAIGGIIGAILTGVCAGTLGGKGITEGFTLGEQVIAQCKAVGMTIAYTGIMSFILLKFLDIIIGLRVTEDQETEGLDIALHDERGYSL